MIRSGSLPAVIGQLRSIQVGQPLRYDGGPEEGPWTTAFFKQPVSGPVHVGPQSIAGDGQADRRFHGGPDKAVLAYVVDHYANWQAEWELPAIPCGGFGENLSIAGVCERQVCLGDVWQIDEVSLQISQPRQPCWKLGRRWARPDLPKRIVQSRRTGWYLRVLRIGRIEAGTAITLEDRPRPDWTIYRCNEVFYNGSPGEKQRLADVPELSLAWKQHLAK